MEELGNCYDYISNLLIQSTDLLVQIYSKEDHQIHIENIRHIHNQISKVIPQIQNQHNHSFIKLQKTIETMDKISLNDDKINVIVYLFIEEISLLTQLMNTYSELEIPSYDNNSYLQDIREFLRLAAKTEHNVTVESFFLKQQMKDDQKHNIGLRHASSVLTKSILGYKQDFIQYLINGKKGDWGKCENVINNTEIALRMNWSDIGSDELKQIMSNENSINDNSEDNEQISYEEEDIIKLINNGGNVDIDLVELKEYDDLEQELNYQYNVCLKELEELDNDMLNTSDLNQKFIENEELIQNEHIKCSSDEIKEVHKVVDEIIMDEVYYDNNCVLKDSNSSNECVDTIQVQKINENLLQEQENHKQSDEELVIVTQKQVEKSLIPNELIDESNEILYNELDEKIIFQENNQHKTEFNESSFKNEPNIENETMTYSSALNEDKEFELQSNDYDISNSHGEDKKDLNILDVGTITIDSLSVCNEENNFMVNTTLTQTNEFVDSFKNQQQETIELSNNNEESDIKKDYFIDEINKELNKSHNLSTNESDEEETKEQQLHSTDSSLKENEQIKEFEGVRKRKEIQTQTNPNNTETLQQNQVYLIQNWCCYNMIWIIILMIIVILVIVLMFQNKNTLKMIK